MEEAELKYEMLQHHISEWINDKLTLLKKLYQNVSVLVGHSPNLLQTNSEYFITSSQSIKGIKELRQFIFREQKEANLYYLSIGQRCIVFSSPNKCKYKLSHEGTVQEPVSKLLAISQKTNVQ